MYSEEFLRQLAKDKVMGAFPPFISGKISAVEKYIQAIVGRIKDDYRLFVEPDFSYYGSGFASYVIIRISKKGEFETRLEQHKNRLTRWTKGVLIYVSNLVPYWYYGASEWSVTVENDKWVGGSSGFLRPESIDEVETELWSEEIEKVKGIFNQYGYCLLKTEELAQQVDFNVDVRTVLADKPYTVFDCFFHWAD